MRERDATRERETPHERHPPLPRQDTKGTVIEETLDPWRDAVLAAQRESRQARSLPAPSVPKQQPPAKQAFEPFRSWAPANGSAAQQSRAAANPSRKLLLLAPACDLPPGYTPRVHGLADATELERRVVEARRLTPLLLRCPETLSKLLDEPRAQIEEQPRAALTTRTLNAVCKAQVGHERLAAMRCTLVHYNEYAMRELGYADLDCFKQVQGASAIGDFLEERDERATLARVAARLRREGAIAAGEPPPRGKTLPARTCTAWVTAFSRNHLG